MSIELIWHPQAPEDLRDIYATIGFASPDAAERLYTSIEAKADMLVHYPRLGRRRADIRPGTSVLIEERYLILYETHLDTDEGPVDQVEIVRVVDGRRNLRTVF
jgi:toxin ParE1/3/4